MIRAGIADNTFRQGAEAMQAQLPVCRDRRRAEQGREFAGRLAPKEVHLEKTVLGVHETGGAGEIFSIACGHGRHTVGVALHRDGPAEPGQFDLSVQRRQAGAQDPPRGSGAGNENRRDDDNGPTQEMHPPSGTVMISKIGRRLAGAGNQEARGARIGSPSPEWT